METQHARESTWHCRWRSTSRFGAIVWIGLGTEDDLGRRFAQGFGVVAGALVGYAMLGLFGRTASSVWAFGVMMLALNFAVWAFALHLLV